MWTYMYTHCVYLVLWTHKVLCRGSYAPHINFHSFSPSVFVVFNYRPGSALFIDLIFATTGYWKAQAAILVVCRRSGNRRLHYVRLRFVSPQEQLFPHCFDSFSISSFLFHFLLSENYFNTASRKMAISCTLQWKHEPHFELPENSGLRLHRAR